MNEQEAWTGASPQTRLSLTDRLQAIMMTNTNQFTTSTNRKINRETLMEVIWKWQKNSKRNVDIALTTRSFDDSKQPFGIYSFEELLSQLKVLSSYVYGNIFFT